MPLIVGNFRILGTRRLSPALHIRQASVFAAVCGKELQNRAEEGLQVETRARHALQGFKALPRGPDHMPPGTSNGCFGFRSGFGRKRPQFTASVLVQQNARKNPPKRPQKSSKTPANTRNNERKHRNAQKYLKTKTTKQK